jgi:hypothetical protein
MKRQRNAKKFKTKNFKREARHPRKSRQMAASQFTDAKI